MIHYQLRCSDGHGFDGWFRDSTTFEAQAARGLIACPECGGVNVRRGLMAPSLTRKGRSRRAAEAPVLDQTGAAVPKEPVPQAEPATAEAAPAEKAGAVMPDRLRAMLQRLRAEVERNCDNVGADFATEARRIHNGEAEQRGIYGETTPEEAEALAEDGIEVARLPWVPRADG